MLEINQSISENLNDDKSAGLTGNEKKINVNNISEEEKKEQEKIINKMKNIADTSGEDLEGSDEEEISEEEPGEDKSDEDEKGEEPDYLNPEDEGEEPEETLKGQFDGFDTLEEYKQHIIAEQNKTAGEAKTDDYQEIENSDFAEPEKQKQIFLKFFDKHSDLLGEKAKDCYLKFYEHNNADFLKIDNQLFKLTTAISSFKDDLPFSERLEKAFQWTFKDDIARKEQKKGEVKAEIRTQKVNKAVSQPTSGGSGQSSTPKFSKAQLWAAEKIGVKLN